MNGTQPIVGPEWMLRAAGGADTDALRVFLTGLSLRTRYLRFFAGVLPVTPAFLRRMSGITASGDLVDALVVTQDGSVIGHGMATDTRDDAGRPVTELAVVVADDHRGRGAGSALIRALTARAQARGATTLLLDVLAENREMLDLVAHYFPAAGYSRSGPYLAIRVPLPVPFPDPAPALPRRNNPVSLSSPAQETTGESGEPSAAARSRTYQWGDPAVSAAFARQVGLTFFREILAGRLPRPPIMETVGLDAVAFEPGRAVFSFTPAEYHYNPIGSVHGGVYATICDSACGCSVHTLLPTGAYYTSLDLAVRFIRPITSTTGLLTCEGTVENIGSRTALATARLTSEDGKLFAHATSNCLIFRP